MNRSTSRFTCEAVPDPDRRAFFTHTAMAAAAGVAAAAGLHAVPAKGATAATTPTADQRKYMEEATRLATESVENRHASFSTTRPLHFAEISSAVMSVTSPSRIGLAISKKRATAPEALWRSIAAWSAKRS
jgi:hypothetical protein